MRTFKFKPGYYEWHLVDADTGAVLHNMVDPSDDLFHEDGECLTLDEITDLCANDLLCADFAYNDGISYNGILLTDNSLTMHELLSASRLMGKVLYDYYICLTYNE